jgi:hypothetical protein
MAGKLRESVVDSASRFASSDSILAKLGRRITGPPPARDAPKMELLLFVRRVYLRALPLALVSYVLAVVYLPTLWAWAVPAVGMLLWVQGFASLSLRIRREHANRHDHGP